MREIATLDARDRATLLAFAGVVVVAGLNFVAVRFSNRELPPFEGACVRFALAAALFGAYARVRGIALPRGRGLVGAALFGVLGFLGSYALAYWGLVSAPAGMGSLAFALVPLITAFLVAVHGLEPLRPRGIAGGALALVGIAVVFADQISLAVPPVALVALLGAAVCAAESGVVVKYFPRSHPAATNTVAMALGATLLALLSVAVGERWTLPTTATTTIAVAYLVVSTIALFALALYVLGRWTASAASFQFPLSPLVTVSAAALVAGERVSLTFVAGGVLVLAGVAVAALDRGRTAERTTAPARESRPGVRLTS